VANLGCIVLIHKDGRKVFGTPLTHISCGSGQFVFGSWVELGSPIRNDRLHLSIHGLEEGIQRLALEAIDTETLAAPLLGGLRLPEGWIDSDVVGKELVPCLLLDGLGAGLAVGELGFCNVCLPFGRLAVDGLHSRQRVVLSTGHFVKYLDRISTDEEPDISEAVEHLKMLVINYTRKQQRQAQLPPQ